MGIFWVYNENVGAFGEIKNSGVFVSSFTLFILLTMLRGCTVVFYVLISGLFMQVSNSLSFFLM